MHRKMGQLGLADQATFLKRGNRQLEQVDRVLDWGPIAEAVSPIYSSPTGRPSFPPLVMAKALLLAQWYRLSDEGLEEALDDRISFRRFVGLGMDEPVPDHATLWRFRDRLNRQSLDQLLLEEVNRQLEAKGLILKQGSLLDASLVKAQAKAPKGGSKGHGARSKADPDANWTRKRGRYHFGYQAHVAVDQGSGLIRKAVLAPAKTSESEVADCLIRGDERAVYADKAYENKKRRKRLKAQGIKDRIMHRSHKNQDGLPYWQQRRNRLIEPIRKRVETTFGTLKRCYGFHTVRYYRHRANETELLLKAVAFNLRRATVLLAA